MGATSVCRDEIAKTVREYDPNSLAINMMFDDSNVNCMLYATQLLTQIEMTMGKQSLTIRECSGIATEYGSQHERAEQAGKLIQSVN